jgi:hypothetical protein
MGTRSTVKFIEQVKDEKTNKVKENVMCAIYQQWDGYASGVGLELAEFLNDIEMVNGISSDRTIGKIANGIGCLSAQYIAHIKKEVGSVYMTYADDYQGYDYEVIIGYEGEGWSMKPKQPIIRVSGLYLEDSDGEMDFEGTPQEFIDLVKKGVVS